MNNLNSLKFVLSYLIFMGIGLNSMAVSADHTALETIAASSNIKSATNIQSAFLVAQAQSSEPIQIQPGPKEVQVELLSAKVTGKILTVTIRYVPGEDTNFTSTNYPIEQVSYIEDATAQQYGVLQDQSGLYLASPKSRGSSRTGEIIALGVAANTGAKIAWFKFPAPSLEAQTISINIPEVAPFDGVTIQR